MTDTQPQPWNPSKSTRILIGIATLWPPIYLFLFMATIGFSFFWIGHGAKKPPHFDLFMYIFPLHCLTMLLSFALTAVYVVHAFKSAQLKQDTRILWVIILFMGNMLAFPVYWWIYLRPGAPRSDASVIAQSPSP